MFSRFSRKKAKEEALTVVERSIKVQLETFVNHLQTVQLSYDNIMKQNAEIIELLKELDKKK